MRFARRYVVENLIAEGGMASIFRARDEQLQRLVAVKVLYPYYADNQVIRARFAEEGRIQQMLGHPNVVTVYEVLDDPLAIVMEHVDGPTLDDYLAEQGQLDESDILDIAVPIMSALGLAHSQGIIHRDLKPSNILLQHSRRGFQPKVMDFGVAKVKDAKHDLTATGTTVGTLHYMSPEQIVGSKNIDGRADIYSLGVTLYKLVTGEVPFNAPTEFALMMAQVEAPPLPPSKLRPDLAPELERIILRAMAKKPVDRFQSIREFTTALLAMRRGSETVRDTITTTISQELIDMAMAADEVAHDRTAEMNLRIVRSSLGAEDNSAEATVEMEQKLSHRANTEEETRDETMELSGSHLIQITSADQTNERRLGDHASSTAATDVLDRKIDKHGRRLDDSSQNVTRPSRPVTRLEPADMPLGDSVDTESIERRVRRQSDRVVVLDADAHSRDLTAPKMSEAAYQSVLGQSGPSSPAAPRVVVGYNPADTEEKTFEKPNFRTKLAQYETAKSNDFDFADPRRGERPEPAPSRKERGRKAAPSSPASPPRPGRPPGSSDPHDAVLPNAPRDPSNRSRQTGRSSRSTGARRANPSSRIVERVDVIAQSAINAAANRNVPAWVVLAGIVAAIAVAMSVMIAIGLFLIV